MTDNLDPQSPVTARLRAMGSQPVDPSTMSEHLTAIASAPSSRKWFSVLRQRAAVAGALLAGLALGTTGAATAGVLGPLQSIAHTAAAHVGAEGVVPDSSDHGGNTKSTDNTVDAGVVRFRGDATNPCPTPTAGATYKNHGQYVKLFQDASEADRQKAAESDCGKPLSAVNKGSDDSSESADTNKPETDANANDNSSDCNRSDAADAEHGKSAEHGKPADTGKPDCVAPNANADDNASGDHGKPADPGSQAGDHSQSDEHTPEAPTSNEAPESNPGS